MTLTDNPNKIKMQTTNPPTDRQVYYLEEIRIAAGREDYSMVMGLIRECTSLRWMGSENVMFDVQNVWGRCADLHITKTLEKLFPKNTAKLLSQILQSMGFTPVDDITDEFIDEVLETAGIPRESLTQEQNECLMDPEFWY